MIKSKKIAAVAAAFISTVTLTGCVAAEEFGTIGDDNDITAEAPTDTETPSGSVDNSGVEIIPPATETPAEKPDDVTQVTVPKVLTVSYLNVLSDGVNIRSGAGTGYTVRGAAEKSTMYALDGSANGWYKTGYKNKPAYISSKYCEVVEMEASSDSRIESVIAEGARLLGTAYVYGAVRYHDGSGKKLSNFNINAFDCSSLMQYIFYTGANVNLQVNTRTQIYQGKTVKKSQLQRGDLMFFTNASRKNLSGVERVGHVALYLGDNMILHTASDYAKIEQISATRWSYFIQGQRVI